MVAFQPDELAEWVSADWENGVPGQALSGISHDTRTLQPGNLYVAIQGDRFDGHRFLSQAFEKGAAGALINQTAASGGKPVLRVPDTLAGLQALAGNYRKSWTGSVVGITGSVGKTTVKEMCAAVLSVKGSTHCTAGNYNNHIGLPLTMLRMATDTQFGIFEIGMNHPGEIGPLARLLRPQIGLLTDLGNAHREHFDSVEDIAREKARLVEEVPESGFVLLDRDSSWFDILRERVKARVVTLSLGGTADYAGRKKGGRVLEINGQPYTMPLPGDHMMRNAMRAIALGCELGLRAEDIAEGLSRFKLPPMRWQVTVADGIHFINDAYNASPLSMHAVLRTFADLDTAGKKWVVLGGMRELGRISDEEHAQLGRLVDELQFDGVITVGELGRTITCRTAQPFSVGVCVEKAAEILRNNLAPGDTVLLKASRAEQLERVLQLFKEI